MDEENIDINVDPQKAVQTSLQEQPPHPNDPLPIKKIIVWTSDRDNDRHKWQARLVVVKELLEDNVAKLTKCALVHSYNGIPPPKQSDGDGFSSDQKDGNCWEPNKKFKIRIFKRASKAKHATPFLVRLEELEILGDPVDRTLFE